MIAIKQIDAFTFEVNGKEINTAITGWGRELTGEEYRALTNYRRGLDNNNVIRFLIGAQIPFHIGINYVRMKGTDLPAQMEYFCLVRDTDKQPLSRFIFRHAEAEGFLLKDLNSDELDYFRSIKSRKFELEFESKEGKIYKLKS
jgi:hypothetical protein